MSAFGKYLRRADGGVVMFRCPGCQEAHQVRVGDGPGPRWGFNEDPERPTFSPSILVRWSYGDPPENRVCHSFVRHGQIEFLGDCTHALAGQTVPLPEWPEQTEVA